jgi:type IV pilus assembly protein PilV
MSKRMNLQRTFGQRGFSIVEAMVALLVLSVGMLGIAGLYVTTLRASGSALYRSHAINFAADMADRIRANPTAGAAYAGAAANNNCAQGATCNPAQLAADDVFRWQQQVATTLPDDGDPGLPQTQVVVVGAAAPRTYQITVRWAEPAEPQPLSYVLRMQI